jgi:hypothetical protein
LKRYKRFKIKILSTKMHSTSDEAIHLCMEIQFYFSLNISCFAQVEGILNLCSLTLIFREKMLC